MLQITLRRLTQSKEKQARRNITQDILLRLTPGIDTHTYEAVATGKVDSKFGSAIETGQADEITRQTLQKEHINLVGFHCHLGSQIFDEDVFERGAEVMLRFIASVRDKYGYTAAQLDLGGGYGVRYTEDDPELDIATKIREVADRVKKSVQSFLSKCRKSVWSRPLACRRQPE